jgi:glycosyltransferase involved in cell wall biosynthesis
MKVALLHDYLVRFGGAERVFLNLVRIFPKAEIFTLLYDRKKMGNYFPDTKIHTSFLQKFPKFWRKRQKYLLPFIPMAVETIDLREFDLVISSSSGFIKGIITRPKTIHICYCHSPMRFGWDAYTSYLKDQRKGLLTNATIRLLMHYIRLWDRASAKRVDYFIANSKTTAQRIRKYYGHRSKIIYPPVSVENNKGRTGREHFLRQSGASGHGSEQGEESERKLEQNSSLGNFASSKNVPCQSHSSNKDYFLIVSQLTPYKRIDLAIEAFNKLGLQLVIIGEGPEGRRLRKMARENIKFLGWQPDDTVKQYFQNCRAFIFAGEDDFGIAPVEAMSFGKPVLAYRKGGATETVLEGITGEFFDWPAPEALADGIRRMLLNFGNYSPLVIKKRAEKFSRERFERTIKEFIVEVVEKKK